MTVTAGEDAPTVLHNAVCFQGVGPGCRWRAEQPGKKPVPDEAGADDYVPTVKRCW